LYPFILFLGREEEQGKSGEVEESNVLKEKK
jgi:hypothetical protein